MRKKLLIISIGIILIAPLRAQTDWGKFLASGVDDAEVLFEGYLSPYLNAFGASMTGGWYNTAKAHKLGGFDLTATFNTAIVPKASRTFDMSELELQNFELADASDNIAPTVAGDNEVGPTLNYSNIPTNPEAFSMPKGSGFPYVPTPMLQLGIGLIKETEIMGRFMPTFNYKDFSIGMWGIGIKHGIKQYIPVLEKVPVLNISVMGGYTRLNSDVGIDIDLADINASSAGASGEVYYEDGTAVDDVSSIWDGQELDLTSTSITGNILVSANLPIVCFYGGIGFATTKTNLKTVGYYPMLEVDQTTPVVVALKDPIDMDVKNQDGNVTKPRFNAGVRFKFGVITIQGDYTYANYSMATIGLGVSFR